MQREEQEPALPNEHEEEEPQDPEVHRVDDPVDQGLGRLVQDHVEHGLALPEQGAPVGDDPAGPRHVLQEEEPDGARQGLEAEHVFSSDEKAGLNKKDSIPPGVERAGADVKMVRVVINSCYGGFGLTEEAKVLFERYSGIDFKELAELDFRASPHLVRVVEELGDGASGDCARLHVVDVPDDVEWQIDEYDGVEWVAEKHRRWV